MGDFREGLATVIVAELDRHVLSTTTFDEDPDCSCGWKGTPYTLEAWELHLGRSVLAAQEAHRQTVECPECGGLGFLYGEKCPAGCIDGRVPRPERLAIVEQVGWRTRFGTMQAPQRYDSDVPVFLLAPDLPETEK